jgi:uncharacterized YigZ family protein
VSASEVDTWLTIRRPSQGETKILGSRFLGFAEPVTNVDQAVACWRARQATFHDATHHCYAYRLGRVGADIRLFDDGEPSGTAGRPILTAIERADLTDIVLVVVRYFGGTKLGVGGLARAYGEAASLTLDAADTVKRFATAILTIGFDHALTSPVMRVLEISAATIVASRYDERAHLSVEVRASQAEQLRLRLTEATRGGAVVEE